MAFQLYVSNSLGELSTKLNERFRERTKSVFQPDYVVIQTEGMGNWLKLGVAAKTEEGIAANIRFLKPNELIGKVYQLLGGRFHKTLAPDNMCWLIYEILGSGDFCTRFPAVAAYYEANEAEKEVRKMALAEKLADLLDQYQVYRPDFISQWNETSPGALGEEEWQAYLWLEARERSGNAIADKTLQGKWILEQLEENPHCADLLKKMPEVHLFGLSIITPYHLNILKALSSYMDISFYFLNGAPTQYWYDTISEKAIAALTAKGMAKREELIAGNPLLTGWGKVMKDTFSMLFTHEELLNAFEEVGVREPSGDTLLKQIQRDIFHNRTAESRNEAERPFVAEKIADGSVTIHSCYTLAREVESLYNYLLHLADEKGVLLSPRDIVVHVSNIDAYAPYIKAVFDNAPERMGYTIADEGFANSDNLISALKALLQIGEDNFTSENILRLLDAASIRRHFGLSNLSLLRKVVDAANIRFGMEGSKEDETVYVSWKYGMQRIMYGICMAGEEEYESGGDSFFPLDLLEGMESAELIRFCHFVEVLIESIEKRKEAKAIAGWTDYISWVVRNLLYASEELVDEDYKMLLNQLQGYNAVHEVVPSTVTYEVFLRHFIGSVSATTRTAAFANGGITFCSLIPMRSIPFKVVAMLGLNFDKFPRKELASGFNLMDEERRKGDRNVKENDKHLFLETLLSAGEYFYISYIGKSVKDNATLPPSALVDELVDYIESCSVPHLDVRKELITLQPLHGFSRKYDSGDSKLYNYLLAKGSGSLDLLHVEKSPEPVQFEEIALHSLVAFIKNPFRTYYNHVLHIRYDDEDVLLGNTEIFELNSLQQWALKHELLTLDNGDREAFRTRMVKTGRLPLKQAAEVSLGQVAEAIAPVKKHFSRTVGERSATAVPVEVPLSGTILKGVLQGVYERQLVFVCFSKKECKYHLEAYIQFLAGCASGRLEGMYFISMACDQVFQVNAFSSQEATKALEAIVQLYERGHRELVPFYPDFDVDLHKLEEMDLPAFQKMVDEKLNGFAYECTDTYILNQYHQGYFKSEDVLKAYKEHCNLLLKPIQTLFPAEGQPITAS